MMKTIRIGFKLISFGDKFQYIILSYYLICYNNTILFLIFNVLKYNFFIGTYRICHFYSC